LPESTDEFVATGGMGLIAGAGEPPGNAAAGGVAVAVAPGAGEFQAAASRRLRPGKGSLGSRVKGLISLLPAC
jgi:hypothetical protein